MAAETTDYHKENNSHVTFRKGLGSQYAGKKAIALWYSLFIERILVLILSVWPSEHLINRPGHKVQMPSKRKSFSSVLLLCFRGGDSFGLTCEIDFWTWFTSPKTSGFQIFASLDKLQSEPGVTPEEIASQKCCSRFRSNLNPSSFFRHDWKLRFHRSQRKATEERIRE